MTTIRLMPVPAGREMPVESFSDLDTLFEKLRSIAEMHLHHLPSLQQHWEEEERQTRVGYSLELSCDVAVSPLTIHCVEEGCIVMGMVDGELRVTVGALDSDEIVAFLHPEWVEFELNELNSYDFASEVLSDWLQDGAIKEKYLR